MSVAISEFDIAPRLRGPHARDISSISGLRSIPVTQTSLGYDAGTEANTEDFGDIVPPCQPLMGVTGSLPGTATSDPALATNDVIHHHPGITGGATSGSTFTGGTRRHP